MNRPHASRILRASIDFNRVTTFQTAGAPTLIFTAGLIVGLITSSFTAALPLSAALAIAYWYAATRRAVAAFLRNQVTDAGRFKHCVCCKYDLRQSESLHCPECGQPTGLHPA